jgi:hypothetical protein
VGQSAFDDPTKQVKSVTRAPVNAVKKSGSLPAVLTYDDVRSVSPALEQYTRGPTHEHGSTTTRLSPSPRPPRSNSCRDAL